MKNVTCDPQSDSRWTSISPIWLVCYEPELVLSWVALSQVCDSQSAALLRTTVLNTILIIWVCSQIHRFTSTQFSKPECFLNFSITAIFPGWVSVGAAYFHCWCFYGTDLSRAVSHSIVIPALYHCNTENIRNYNQNQNIIRRQIFAAVEELQSVSDTF